MSIAKKRKVGTTLNEFLLKRLKLQAVEENRPIADVISDAIEQYLALRQAEDESPTRFPKLLKNQLLKNQLSKHPAVQGSLTEIRAMLQEDAY